MSNNCQQASRQTCKIDQQMPASFETGVKVVHIGVRASTNKCESEQVVLFYFKGHSLNIWQFRLLIRLPFSFGFSWAPRISTVILASSGLPPTSSHRLWVWTPLYQYQPSCQRINMNKIGYTTREARLLGFLSSAILITCSIIQVWLSILEKQNLNVVRIHAVKF